MALPTVMADLSTTAASNSPAGSEAPTSNDDFLRTIQALLRHGDAKGSDVASATTTDLSATTGKWVDVTGSVTITGLGTVAAGIERVVRFTGAPLLTHNGTSLILPGAANIQATANDCAIFRSLGSGNWQCINYSYAAGLAAKNIQNQTYVWCGTAGGTANALTLTPSPAILAYVAGQAFEFKAASTNTATSTIAISGLTTVTVQLNGAALVGGEIEANQFYRILLDTTGTAQLTKLGAKYNLQSSLNLAKGTAIASGATIDPFGVADGNTFHVTGTTSITGFTAAAKAGMVRTIIFDAACQMKFNALLNNPRNSATQTYLAGDAVTVYADTTTSFIVIGFTSYKNNANGNVTSMGIPTITSVSFDLSSATGTNVTFTTGETPRAWILHGAIAGRTGGVPATITTGITSITGSLNQCTAGAFGSDVDVYLQTSATAYQKLTQSTITSTSILFTNTKTSTPTGTVILTLFYWI